MGTSRLKGVLGKRRATPNLSFVLKEIRRPPEDAATDVNRYILGLRKAQYVRNATRADVSTGGARGY